MTIRPSFRHAAPSRLLLLLVFACLGVGLTSCARPRPAPRPVGRGGIRLRAAAGTYLRFVITPGLDPVVVRQWGGDGKLVQQAEVQADPDQPTHLSWLVASSGVYIFTLSLAPEAVPQTAGVYAMALEEQRPAGPCDAIQLRAEQEVRKAHLLLWNNGDPAAALAASDSGVDAAIESGNRETRVAALLERASATESRDHRPTAVSYGRFIEAGARAREIGDRQGEAAALAGASHLAEAPVEDSDRAVQLEMALGNRNAEAEVHRWRADHREKSGDLDGAISEYRLVLDREGRIGDVAGQSHTLEMLGQLAGTMGDFDTERIALDVAATLAVVAADRALQGSIDRVWALLDASFGDLQGALDRYRQIYVRLSSPRTGGEAAEAARARYGFAMIQLYLNKPQEARASLTAALSTFSELHDAEGIARARLGLGAAWQTEKRPDKALQIFRQVYDELKRTGASSDIKALAAYTLGKADARDRPAQAVVELQEAVRLSTSLYAQQQAQIQLALAQALARAPGEGDAEQALERAVTLARRARSPLMEAAALKVRADFALAHGRLDAARAAITRAVQLTEGLRDEVIRPNERAAFLEARRAYFETEVEVLAHLDSRAAFAASEQARARELLDLLTRQKVDVGMIVPADLKRRQRDVEDRVAHAQKALLAVSSLPLRSDGGYADTTVARLERDLTGAEEEERKLAAEVDLRHPGYAQIRAVLPPPLDEVQRLLDERTALLEYFVGMEGSYLFVVTREGLHLHPVPARPQLDPLVERVDAALEQDSPLRGERFAADSYRLYEDLLQPAAAELAGKTRLLVAPDGPLYRLSFEALLTLAVPGASRPRRSLPYLVRERTISYVPSAGVLEQLLRKRRPAGESAVPAQLFVGFGDPQAQLPPEAPAAGRRGTAMARDRPVPLPAAGDEVRVIGNLFPPGQGTVFNGPDASVENVQRSPRVGAARFLHFASHARLIEGQPGLQLAVGNGSRQDGLLRVRDVFDLDLRADLVVLSACSTGLGREVAGEGILGLTRAFLYAGASGVVVSLWQVDDAATGELMKSFYGHLLSPTGGGDPAEALRQAKLELLDLHYPHPYYWAPFILTGDPR